MPNAIGLMRERVEIQKAVKTPNQSGGYAVSSWTEVDEVWAEVKPVSSSQQLQALAQSMVITHRVVIRWRGDLAGFDGETYRLVWREREMHIIGRGLNYDEQKIYLELTCTAGDKVAT